MYGRYHKDNPMNYLSFGTPVMFQFRSGFTINQILIIMDDLEKLGVGFFREIECINDDGLFIKGKLPWGEGSQSKIDGVYDYAKRAGVQIRRFVDPDEGVDE